jgi:hypothetical protein
MRRITRATVDRTGNRYCGPLVLAALMGCSTAEAAAKVRRVNGDHNRAIKGMHNYELIKTLKAAGHTLIDVPVAKHLVEARNHRQGTAPALPRGQGLAGNLTSVSTLAQDTAMNTGDKPMMEQRVPRHPSETPAAKPTARDTHRSPDGRVWWIAEGHPQTNKEWAVCRLVENGFLTHTAIWARKDLTPQETQQCPKT